MHATHVGTQPGHVPEDAAQAGGAEFQHLTFVTTDIVGSAELHRRHPVAMVDAMEQHDVLLHGAIRAEGGDPFKHTGDGVIATFDDPLAAVRALVTAQREMRAATWGAPGRPKLRAGVHYGPARARSGDWFGPAMSTVHRLEGAAHADQILISEATVAEIGPARQSEISFSDLGAHHFKGVERLRVFQVDASGLPTAHPPLGGKRETRNGNLPATTSTFLGRASDLSALQGLVDAARIVTLVGPGGIGKTRLALELGRALEPAMPGGGWFLNLAALEAGSDLWPVVAGVFEIEPMPGADRRQQVIDRLRDQRTLLVVDNCEHLLDAVADLVAELCAACPALQVVATSRQMLDLDGEAQYSVAPMEPGPGAAPEDSVAAELFLERARLVRHGYAPDSAARALIGQICASLDYIPLAIEIAAGQLRRYPLERIAQDAENPLDLSAGSGRRSGRRGDRRGASSEAKTLRRTLEWSVGLIHPQSAEVLDYLSVFSSPFHEEQAMELCARHIDDEIEVLDAIDELIDASLLSPAVEGERRIRMLRTVQAFGQERLEADGRHAALDADHAEVMIARSKALGKAYNSPDERGAAQAIQDDMPNLRAAFERALTRDLETAARITWPLLLYTYFHRESETASWPTRIMAQPGADALPDAPVMLAGCAAYAFHELGDAAAARGFIERGQALEAAGHNSSQGWLAHIAGQVAFWMRDTDLFRACSEQAVEEAKAANDVACQVVDLAMAAFVEARTRNPDRAAATLAQLETLEPLVGQPSLIGYFNYARGGVASLDDLDTALTELRSAAEWAEMGGNRLGALRTGRIISDIRAIQAEPREALAIQISALRDLPDSGATIYNWTALSRLLAPLAKLGGDAEIAVLSGALEAAPITLGTSARRYMDVARERLGDDAFETGAARGRSMGQSDARAFAIDHVGAMEF
ncbi:MAG: adenylate/guanylate cyclase domain-containing protein [Pseudomonadota bacterium]